MPYITPEQTPTGDTCWCFVLPDDPHFRAAFFGAVSELMKTYNWEQTTGITVQETVAIALEMYESGKPNKCTGN